MTTTYATETLTEAFFDEVAPLLERHYEEIAHWKDMKLNAHREKYMGMAKANVLRIFTARNDGVLIGYCVYFISPSLHYAPFNFAHQDILFIDKPHRGSTLGLRLVRYSHQELKKDKVDVVFQHTKAREELNIGAFLRRVGYELLDEIYAYRLDKEK